jgi:hypothetical protein
LTAHRLWLRLRVRDFCSVLLRFLEFKMPLLRPVGWHWCGSCAFLTRRFDPYLFRLPPLLPSVQNFLCWLLCGLAFPGARRSTDTDGAGPLQKEAKRRLSTEGSKGSKGGETANPSPVAPAPRFLTLLFSLLFQIYSNAHLCYLCYLLFKFPLLPSVRASVPRSSPLYGHRRGGVFTEGSEEKTFNRRQQR